MITDLIARLDRAIGLADKIADQQRGSREPSVGFILLWMLCVPLMAFILAVVL